MCGRTLEIGLAAMVALGLGGAAQAQPFQDFTPQVQVEHAAARLIVIAEPRSDVSVTISHGPSRLPPLSLRQEHGRVIVDGGLGSPFGEHIDCRGGLQRGPFGVRDTREVVTPVAGRTPFAELPVITAHVPLDTRVASAGAVWGEVGATRSLEIANAGCGDWTAGPVQAALGVILAGSGDVRTADVGNLHARITGSSTVSVGNVRNGVDARLAGSGDLHAGSISGLLQAVVSGSGDITADRLDGPVHAGVSGSGDIKLRSGRAPEVNVQVAGSGGFTFGGQAGRVAASSTGSGDVRIAHATGPVSRAISGSGEIDVGR